MRLPPELLSKGNGFLPVFWCYLPGRGISTERGVPLPRCHWSQPRSALRAGLETGTLARKLAMSAAA